MKIENIEDCTCTDECLCHWCEEYLPPSVSGLVQKRVSAQELKKRHEKKAGNKTADTNWFLTF